MEAPPSNIREVERGEIARSFIALGSLLHIRKLLSSHGIQQARKFLEEKLKKGYCLHTFLLHTVLLYEMMHK